MRNISKILLVFTVAMLAQAAVAQPPRRRAAAAQKEQATGVALSERAKAQYPTATTPDEVMWKREIYRSLDLAKEKNAALYYPVMPQGGNANLFTTVLRLIVDGTVSAYEYDLDGNESLTPENRISVTDLLDKYTIAYTQENGKIKIEDNDIPSNEVLSYYIKECYYFDQRTSTYNQRVVALCPVLHRSGTFSLSEVVKYPMFWLSYDEVSPYLAQVPVMASSYNNIQNMSLGDYFIKHQYEGEIYKTVNLRNMALNQYCPDSTALKNEQRNIEQQLADFERRLWKGAEPAPADEPADSAAVAATPKSKKGSARSSKASSGQKSETKSKSEAKTKQEKSSSSSGAARVSVRRQRR